MASIAQYQKKKKPLEGATKPCLAQLGRWLMIMNILPQRLKSDGINEED